MFNGIRSYLNRPILERIDAMANKITADLKQSIEAYIAAVEQGKTDVAAIVAKAVADDEAGIAVDLKALKEEFSS